MSIKRLTALIMALCIFLLSSLIAWYEGAEIYDDPWEWENTAFFSNLVNEQVISSPDEIIVIDHFIYAAKFQPLFPFLMVVSLLALFYITIYSLFKKNPNFLLFSYILVAASSLFLFFLIRNSPTPGFKLFTYLFGIVGLISVIIILYYSWKLRFKTYFSKKN